MPDYLRTIFVPANRRYRRMKYIGVIIMAVGKLIERLLFFKQRQINGSAARTKSHPDISRPT
jgi:hypothetical protein